MYSESPNTKTMVNKYNWKGDSLMFNELNNVMWNIFEKTGNIYAYLYVQEYNKNKSEIRAEIQPLEMKETTII